VALMPRSHNNQRMDRLRLMRKRARLTQEQLAEKVGVEQGYISRIERGKQSPSLDVTYRLAAALGVNPGDLFEKDGLSLRIQQIFDELPPDQQEAALSVLEAFVRALPKDPKE
jgi:transcriptional regulator with XRE-family HTH domain